MRRGGETAFAVSMVRIEEPDPTAVATTCTAYGNAYNRDGTCFDQRPVPNGAQCHGDPRYPPAGRVQAAVIVLNNPPKREGGHSTTDPPERVRPAPSSLSTGVATARSNAAETVQIKQRSDSPQFTLLAVDFARRLSYNPAQKGGRPVTAYFEQVFRPGRRP